MIQFLRILFLVILIFVALVDIKQIDFALEKEWQYIFSLGILFTLIFVDIVSGFIFGLILATIYIRLYDIKILPDKIQKMEEDRSKGFHEKDLEFITPLHLKKAQTNIVSEVDYTKEYKGIKGVYGEAVYGAQGIDVKNPGYSSFELENNWTDK